MKSAMTIILGGGVIGLSTAYHLARKRFGRIILVEKGPLGDGSSSRAAGIMTGLLTTETAVRLRKRCLELCRELSEELQGYHFRSVGCLNLISGGTWPQRQALLPLYERCGAPYDVLAARDIGSFWPALQPPDGMIGLFEPRGGYSEPSEYLPALKRRVQELGVEIREFTRVSGFKLRSNRVTGVEIDNGKLEGDAFVSTVHSWTTVLLKSIAFRFPVKYFVHQRYVSRPLGTPPAVPVVNANPWQSYFVPPWATAYSRGSRQLSGRSFGSRPSTLTRASCLCLRASSKS